MERGFLTINRQVANTLAASFKKVSSIKMELNALIDRGPRTRGQAAVVCKRLFVHVFIRTTC